MERLRQARVVIRGAGELGSATGIHLFEQGIGRVLLVEQPFPKAVRRNVCYSEAVFDHAKTVDGVTARFIMELSDVDRVNELGDLAITTQPLDQVLEEWPPDVFVEAAMLRHNLWGLAPSVAPVVVALGPGYQPGEDCHAVVDTVRGPDLGRVVRSGDPLPAEPPAEILGYSKERLIKAPRTGLFRTSRDLGERIEQGDKIGVLYLLFERDDLYRGVPVDSELPVVARISGMIRGLLRDGVPVEAGDKIGDIDPRGLTEDIIGVSDKAKRVAEGVLEALILNVQRLRRSEPNVAS